MSSLVPFGVIADDLQKEGVVQDSNENEGLINRYLWSRHVPSPDKPHYPKDALGVEGVTRIRMVSKSLCCGEKTNQEKIQLVMGYLNSRMRYDMSTRFCPDSSMDPTEYFLFQAKKGWCVHFASAAALMLRSVGIPTRMVTGYAVVSGKDSCDIVDSWGHAWCEALVDTDEGRRWVIVDAAAPSVTRAVRKDHFRHFAIVVGLAGVVIIFLKSGGQVEVRDLRREMLQQSQDLSEVERICAAYDRCLRYLKRLGIQKPDTMSPRRFVRDLVPITYRSDFAVITDAFERVTYMGYCRLGSLLVEVDQAQDRLISKRIRA